ncbi:MAG: cutinase family protein, partial [Actinomycetales bacterium]
DVTVLQVRNAGGTVTSSTSWTTTSVKEVDLTDDLVVPAGVTLRIGPDVTVNTQGHDVVVRGRLVAGQGGSTVFQSTSGAREKGQWQGIQVLSGGTADLGSSLLQDAVVALDVDASSSAVWHGTVRSSAAGLNADGFTDARDVDWGSSSGPSPYGTGASTQGAEAQVVPWAGYAVPPTRTAVSQPTAPCRDIVLLAARGSREGPQGDGTYESDPYSGMGAIGYYAGAGALQTVLLQHPSTTWDMRAIRYPASLYPGFTSGVTWPEYVNSLVQGALGVRTAIRALEADCPSSKVLLIGASQGAGVVRLGIAGLTSAERESILAVGLVGDPLRTAGGAELLWQSADTPAPATTLQRSGLLSADVLEEGASNEIPADVVSRTVSLCRSDDLVCAPGPGATVEGHVAYSSDDITGLARWLGAEALAGLG